jgi:hypothetical protein
MALLLVMGHHLVISMGHLTKAITTNVKHLLLEAQCQAMVLTTIGLIAIGAAMVTPMVAVHGQIAKGS